MFDDTAVAIDGIDEQLALEEEMVDAGAAAFLRANEKKQERGDLGVEDRYVMRRLIGPVIEGIQEFLTNARSAPGRGHSAAPFIYEVGPEVGAFIALRCAFSAIGADRKNLPSLTSMIGTGIELELGMRRFKASDRDLFRATKVEAEKHTAMKQRHAVAARMIRRAGVDPQWTETRKHIVGLKLFEIMRERTGLFEVLTVSANKRGKIKSVNKVAFTQEAAIRMAEVLDVSSKLRPMLLPMVIPPRPWTTGAAGGYYSTGLNMKLVKPRFQGIEDALKDGDMALPMRAVNAVQATPWVVSERVLEVLREAFSTGRRIAGMPGIVPEVPPYPPEADTDPAVKKLWKRGAAAAYEERRKDLGRRVQVSRTVAVAEKFVGRPIYFPHSMDFRGRIYSIPSNFCPQGPDYAKALLLFGKSHPINCATAAGWLAITGANRYGFDKCSLLHRIKWVEDHEEAIASVDEDPWGAAFDFWAKADEPFQFLAFCFEWAAFKRHGWGFQTSLPVNLDGSCNGLQHFSAAFRDPIGGKAVNLLPAETPQDIYGVVAERTKVLLEELLRPDGPRSGKIAGYEKMEELLNARGTTVRRMAEAWQKFGIDRKITKRPVMTLPYGSTQFSCREFIEDAIKEKLDKGIPNPFTDAPETDVVAHARSTFNASLALQPLVWQSIGETVVAARQGMDWLQQCAKEASYAGLPLQWETADGFVVVQNYREFNTKRIEAMIDGRILKMRVQTEESGLDTRAQYQGVAPNWVHSQDACALRMFVNTALDHDITDFSLIHDSFGCPAPQVETMLACLKETFISLYTDQDPAAMFYVDMISLMPEGAGRSIPRPPAKGTLDLTEVRKSDYFFA